MKAFVSEAFTMFDATQHLTTQTTIDFSDDGHTALAKSACHNPMVFGGDMPPKMMVVGLWYVDTLVRTPSGWRFQERVGRTPLHDRRRQGAPMTTSARRQGAIVSGIGPGMGRDISLQFAEHGAKVVAGARTLANVEAVVDEVKAAGGDAIGVQLDITDNASCERRRRHGARDVRSHRRAGQQRVLRRGSPFVHERRPRRLASDDEHQLLRHAPALQAVVPAMKEQGEGRIIMINSMSAVKIEPRFGAYAASKAALGAVTKTLAVELGPFGITCERDPPGLHLERQAGDVTSEYLAQRNGITYEEQFESIAGTAALRYLPHSSEIVGAVVFFASDLAKPITGQALHVNGGHWLGGF